MNFRTARRPKFFSPASRSAPGRFALATASWCCRSIIQFTSRNESRCSISCRTDASNSAPARGGPEGVERLRGMGRGAPFRCPGKSWLADPPVSVIPKPIQKPHPPMWVAATNPTTFELAAERGLGVLCFTLGVELAQVAERINIYRNRIKSARPVGQTINNQVSMNIMGLVGDDPFAAEHIAREAVLWYVRKGFELVSSIAAASQTDESYKYLKTASKFDPAKFTSDYYDFLNDADLIATVPPH